MFGKKILIVDPVTSDQNQHNCRVSSQGGDAMLNDSGPKMQTSQRPNQLKRFIETSRDSWTDVWEFFLILCRLTQWEGKHWSVMTEGTERERVQQRVRCYSLSAVLWLLFVFDSSVGVKTVGQIWVDGINIQPSFLFFQPRFLNPPSLPFPSYIHSTSYLLTSLHPLSLLSSLSIQAGAYLSHISF